MSTKSSDIYQDLQYWYDPVGNITQIQDDAQQTLYYSGSVVSPDQDFTYDALCRLVIATGREQIGTATFGANDNTDDAPWQTSHIGNWSAVQNYTQFYTYDELGNITELQHLATAGSYTRTYAYDPSNNRLDSTTVGSDTYNYTYDNRGNMLTMPHLSAMDWNAQNELYHTDNGTIEAYYNYSGGQRIRKVAEKTGAIKEVRIYLGSFELYRKYVSGTKTLERTTVHISDDTGRIAMLEHRTVGSDSAPSALHRYVYSNHLSTASLELDENADIISYEEYHPYGTTSYQAMNATINAVAKRYRYTGKERDEETGLYYHGARYYIPWLCRWSAVDPLENKFAGMSPYNYSYNNPIIWSDKTGMEPNDSGNGQTGQSDDDKDKDKTEKKYNTDPNAWKPANNSQTPKPPSSPDTVNTNSPSSTVSPSAATTEQSVKVKEMLQITLKQMKEIFPKGKEGILKKYVDLLNQHMNDYGIDSEKKLAHFLAQAGTETGGFQKESITEGATYTTQSRLDAIFGDKFRTAGRDSKKYLNNGEALLNFVYGNEVKHDLGNGNEASGDGYKFRGRGVMQLTGRDNYQKFTDSYQEKIDDQKDFTQNPDLVASDLPVAIISALWFFEEKVMKRINVETATVAKVTPFVNSGSVALDERKAYYNKAIDVLKK